MDLILFIGAAAWIAISIISFFIVTDTLEPVHWIFWVLASPLFIISITIAIAILGSMIHVVWLLLQAIWGIL